MMTLYGQSVFSITGFNSDFPVQVVFRANVNIPPNSTFYYTDNEWNGSSFNTGEITAYFFTNSTWTVLAGSTFILEGVTPPSQCGLAFQTGVPTLAVSGDEFYITKINPGGGASVAASDICFAVSLGAVGGGGMPPNSISTSFDNGIYNGSGDITNPANWTFSDNHMNLPIGSCNFSLPVTLIAFSLSLNENDVLLNWKTASEINNSHFDVEHSTDGINFEVIGSVEGHGTSTQKQSYTFTHYNLSDGIHYYRLTQVDYDGRSETFEVKSFQLGSKNKFRVFPSETSDFINVENPSDEAIALYDVNGKLLFNSQNQSKIDVSHLASGIYFVKSQQDVVKFRKI
jgi:Secretion system C-terminal sorting domain